MSPAGPSASKVASSRLTCRSLSPSCLAASRCVTRRATTFDNSSANVNNPDPTQRVTFGEQIWDEMLTMAVDPEHHEMWLAAQEAVWTRFLEQQPGYVRSEIWLDAADDHHLHVMIWWSSREEWKQITAEQVAAIDSRLGPLYREPVVREFRVVS